MVIRIIFLILQTTVVFMYYHKKPLPEKLWSQNCDTNSMVLNECNWCTCRNNKYVCKARDCGEIDAFGHFNDATQNINVGMEGHGVWRSGETECEPGVEYERGDLFCLCGKNGRWPSPDCRKTLRVLRTVERSQYFPVGLRCKPGSTKFYGCYFCTCGISGEIGPTDCEDLCTENRSRKFRPDNQVTIIGAECDEGKRYIVDSKICKCFDGSKLRCYPRKRGYCSSSPPGELFDLSCNHCFCTKFDEMYCTSKNCLDTAKIKYQFNVTTTKLPVAETPADDADCTPGTQYKKGCKKCKCFVQNYMKAFSCTVSRCSQNENNFGKDCVIGTAYEKNCHQCQCVMVKGVKQEVCSVENHCLHRSGASIIHGFCKPERVYQQDCNTCKCQDDGQTLKCTTNICKSLEVDMVPVVHSVGRCPSGYTYKIDCNICYCLSNGNVLCTLTICNGK